MVMGYGYLTVMLASSKDGDAERTNELWLTVIVNDGLDSTEIGLEFPPELSMELTASDVSLCESCKVRIGDTRGAEIFQSKKASSRG